MKGYSLFPLISLNVRHPINLDLVEALANNWGEVFVNFPNLRAISTDNDLLLLTKSFIVFRDTFSVLAKSPWLILNSF